jgi:hypothetical protein
MKNLALYQYEWLYAIKLPSLWGAQPGILGQDPNIALYTFVKSLLDATLELPPLDSFFVLNVENLLDFTVVVLRGVHY